MRARRGIVTRLLQVEGDPIVVRAMQRRDGSVVLRAEGATAPSGALEVAIERMRFALGVDDDYHAMYREFRRDRLLGRAIRRLRWHRPRRRPFAWEALAWAVTKQLIESPRAAEIQRRMVFKWGAQCEGPDGSTLRDVPTPELIAERAPAELAAADLAPARALALIRAAREVSAGRVDPANPQDDRRLLAIREIGPWTVQCLTAASRARSSLPRTTGWSPPARRCAWRPSRDSYGILPGKRSFVRTSSALGRAWITPLSAKKCAKASHCFGSM